jgi:type II secretory pathway pseudopilin PulG
MLEVMVAMAVAGIVISGILAFSSMQRKLASESQRESRVQQTLDGAMWAMGQDVRMAGVGFTRVCTELRIWDGTSNRLINPGAIQSALSLGSTVTDEVTGEPYWVLRDGVQAHWRSQDAGTLPGTAIVSAHPSSAADSFDVALAEGNFASSSGMFRIAASNFGGALATGATAQLELTTIDAASLSLPPGVTAAALASSNPEHLAAAQQMFPPGSFVLIAPLSSGDTAFRPAQQSQCALLQVTGNLEAGATDTQWLLPISSTSGFNANLENLLGLPTASADYAPRSVGAGGTGDWLANPFASSAIVALGNFRWSRYEVDYTYSDNPFLVRTDIIGWVRGDPVVNSAGVPYPNCPSNECPLPKLRLPELVRGEDSPPRIAVAPMVEDMQVSVGCDGYTTAAVDALLVEVGDTSDPRYFPPPDAGFDEKGSALTGLPNFIVDEWDSNDDRANDEWLGNAQSEEWAPDCVFYGTGQAYADSWPAMVAAENKPGPGFRMSPQVLRISLLSRSDDAALFRLDTGTSMAQAIEDRPRMASVVSNRTAHFASARFAPRNLRWRDPDVE